MKWMALVAIASLAGFATGEDVVFSATHIREIHGKFFPIDTPHLYRVGRDGKQPRQITFGDWADTQPSLAQDRKHVLFWRKNKNDLVSDSLLCSIGVDGTGFRELRKVFDDGRLDLGTLKRALLGTEPYQVKPVRTSDDSPTFQVLAPNGKAHIKRLFPDIGPNERYLTYETDAITRYQLDLRTGKEVEIRGIPSTEGGTLVPDSIAWLDENALIFGFFGSFNLFRITMPGKTQGVPRHFHRIEHAKPVDLDVYGDTQWRQNPGGVRAFRYGEGGKNILLQIVDRTDDGGTPTLYGFVASTGEVRLVEKGLFLEDAALDRRTFLVSSWNWGKGWLGDGTVPLRVLSRWDVDVRKVVPVSTQLMSCEGACFVPDLGMEDKARK